MFNIEGGCYAKCIGLNPEKEPEIYNAVRFGSILENVAYDKNTRAPYYDDDGITENTRCAYPIEYIPNAKIPCIADAQPSNIIYVSSASGFYTPNQILLADRRTFVHVAHLRRLRCPATSLQA